MSDLGIFVVILIVGVVIAIIGGIVHSNARSWSTTESVFGWVAVLGILVAFFGFLGAIINVGENESAYGCERLSKQIHLETQYDRWSECEVRINGKWYTQHAFEEINKNHPEFIER